MKPFLVALFALSVLTTLHAGDKPIYVDYNPEYTKLLDNYTIDKIEYFKNEMVIHVRFASTPNGGLILYYGPQSQSSWYLKGENTNYELQAVRNIAQDRKILVESLKPGAYYDHATPPNTFFTCEIVFSRLPDNITTVDLIEGQGNESNPMYLNIFNLLIKDSNSKDLSTAREMRKRIEAIKKTSSQ